MKTKSAKAKARRLQDWVVGHFKWLFGYTDDDIRPALMGEGGADVKLISLKARKRSPYAIECKYRESYKGVYDIIDQATQHDRGLMPLGVIKMNRRDPLIIMYAEDFFSQMDLIEYD